MKQTRALAQLMDMNAPGRDDPFPSAVVVSGEMGATDGGVEESPRKRRACTSRLKRDADEEEADAQKKEATAGAQAPEPLTGNRGESKRGGGGGATADVKTN